jgi:Ca2+-transporting ATPase
MIINDFNVTGLTNEQVTAARKKFGVNKLDYKKENTLFDTINRVATEPMMILLLVAASIYFISGKIGDGIFLLAAIVFQTSISLYQYSRSKNALEKLKS